ncbi:MAG: hypothetical protein JRG91_01400 [Deltaproteobacteria bacterium]|nr:hypothetical protein [Deltaproteobacteria bacterium]
MSVMDGFRDAGVGMWVLLIYLGVALPLVWGFGVFQLMALIRWKRGIDRIAGFASNRDVAGLLEEVGGGRGVVVQTITSAAKSIVAGDAIESIMAGVRDALHHRLAANHPARAVLAAMAISLSIPAPLALGMLFRSLGQTSSWSVLGNADPGSRCGMLEQALRAADFPFWLSLVVVAVLVVPALVAVFMELTALRAKRRRDDVLRLAEMLLGVSTRPATGAMPGVVAFIFTVLLAGAAGWVLTGPPVKNLAAVQLYGSCLPGLDHLNVEIPVHGGGASDVVRGVCVIVTMDDLLVDDVRVTDLDKGSVGAAASEDGVTITPLAQMLEDREEWTRALCDRSPDGAACETPVLVAIDRAVPLASASAVLATARRSWGRSVFLVVRTEEPPASPPRFADMLAAVKGFASMKCVTVCPYGLVEVGDVIADPASGSKDLLDGRADGTFGTFIDGVGGPSFDVAVP